MKMIANFEGKQYSTLFGSDVGRDGVYLELNDVTDGHPKTLIEAFRSDIDGKISFTCFKENLPFEVVEKFILEVRDGFPKKEKCSL